MIKAQSKRVKPNGATPNMIILVGSYFLFFTMSVSLGKGRGQHAAVKWARIIRGCLKI